MVRILNRKASTEKRAKNYNRRNVSGSQRWTDPFPEVHGTLPEKMVYAELSRRGIPFLFLNDTTINIPEIEVLKDYQADFIFPDLKLIIEVQGAYFHSMEKTIEADAIKFTYYEMMGFKALAWWDFDIMTRLTDLFLQEPLLQQVTAYQKYFNTTEMTPVKRTKIDTSKGIRTLNSRRMRGEQPRAGRRSLRKARSAYATR